eukprot:474796-Lingulodinium_polyedra.AAC.1
MPRFNASTTRVMLPSRPRPAPACRRSSQSSAGHCDKAPSVTGPMRCSSRVRCRFLLGTAAASAQSPASTVMQLQLCPEPLIDRSWAAERPPAGEPQMPTETMQRA